MVVIIKVNSTLDMNVAIGMNSTLSVVIASQSKLTTDAGRSGSDTVQQQSARLSRSYFMQHCTWPPPAANNGVQLAYRVWRKPLYVAGRYLKLLRGIAQVPVCCCFFYCLVLVFLFSGP